MLIYSISPVVPGMNTRILRASIVNFAALLKDMGKTDAEIKAALCRSSLLPYSENSNPADLGSYPPPPPYHFEE